MSDKHVTVGGIDCGSDKRFDKFEGDSIIVVDGARPTRVLDIQGLVKLGLLGPDRL